jgi:hypothetical protein
MGISEYWNWNHKLPIDIFYNLQICGYPGWDRFIKDGHEHEFCVLLECRSKIFDSRDIAEHWDDIAHWQFYYRDRTRSGMPFTSSAEEYISLFYFQSGEDAKRFAEMYKGAGNWEGNCEESEFSESAFDFKIRRFEER